MTETKPSGKFIKIYRKSEIIFKENSLGDEMYIICSGKVKLTTVNKGRELVLAILEPKEFFGEMALISDSPRAATAIAEEENTRLIVLNQARFLYLVGQQPPFALYIMQGLCERLKDRWADYLRMLAKASEKTSPPR